MRNKFMFLFYVLMVISVGLSNCTRPIGFKFYQDDYTLEFQRAEMVNFNNKLVKRLDMRTFKYNRTCPVMNMTKRYNIDIGNDLEVILQAYKFMSNEYRYFPIRVQVNFCSTINEDLAGMSRFLACGNFTGCPLKKDTTYHICNFAPDPSKFPPLIPDGDYMMEYQGLYRSVELWVIRGYAKIFRPILIP